MGKRKNRKKGGPPFVPIFKLVIYSEPWKQLSHTEKLIYIHIKANYNGSNNGEISLKYDDLNDQYARATIKKALKGLEEKGWVEKTRHGGLYRFHCKYRLTLQYDKVFKCD